MLSGEIIDVKASNLRIAYGEADKRGIPLYLMCNKHEIKIGTLLFSECTFYQIVETTMRNDTEFAEKYCITDNQIYSVNPDAMTFGTKHLSSPMEEFKSYEIELQEAILQSVAE